jgi:hypothetical protein
VRADDLLFDYSKFPRAGSRDGNIRLDDTILAGVEMLERRDFGFRLRPASRSRAAVGAEIAKLISPLGVGYQVATEASAGSITFAALEGHIQLNDLFDLIKRDYPGYLDEDALPPTG